ncbi:MAG: Uma2 family endonuclease [Sphingobacteriales bacterium]|nr:Uma2 family endonuclease [Sphingobacteriales bacterium]
MNTPAPTTSLSTLDLSKVYSYADYLTWQFAERVELIKGYLMKMAAPSRFHQQLAGRIHGQLFVFLQGKKCQPFFAPFDVRLLNKNHSTPDNNVYSVVQPDLCVVCDLDKLDERGCNGAPEWIIEILSPGNSKHDVATKYKLYEEAGVLEYWVVMPQQRLVNVFDLDTNAQKYQFRATYTEEDIAPSQTVEGLTIDLAKVFAEM